MGRILIERAVRKRVIPQKPHHDLDFVLALDDHARIGALRFRTAPDSPFLAASRGRLPPSIRLSALLRAADAIHGETETAQDLAFLLGAGSPLGGARPKAAVILPDGSLAMAKFPKPDDTRDVAAGEVLALAIAARAGIDAAGHRLASAGGRNVAVIRRFDREKAGRIPFVSAASLMAGVTETGSYTMIADAIRQFGANIEADLLELWKRMVFSLLISNCDDHLRNHGFLMREKGRWSLSPAFDINPVPEIERRSISQTSISEETEDPSVETALSVTERFGLKQSEARDVLSTVFQAISNWRATGCKLGLRSRTLEAYASAFENPWMEEARGLLRH